MASQRINEKQTPHYSLIELKTLLLNDETSSITQSSISDAFSLGFSKTEMIDAVQLLKRDDFYKSMTTYHDSSLWQDVYHLRVRESILYIKLQKSFAEKGVIISFKEK